MVLDDLKVGKVYSFNTVSPQFLGTRIERAKLTAVTNTPGARFYTPVDQLYAQVYPSLPPGITKDINSRIWYVFEYQNGSTGVLCDQWIVESSLVLVESVGYRIYIPDASLGQGDMIKQALAGIGIYNPVISSE